MAKAATPATKKTAVRPKAPAKAGATKAAPARKPRTVKAAKDHPIRDQIAVTRDTIKTEASKKAATLKDERSEEHTSELQSLMRISYAVFCLKKKKTTTKTKH